MFPPQPHTVSSHLTVCDAPGTSQGKPQQDNQYKGQGETVAEQIECAADQRPSEEEKPSSP